jgi:hypothetical protein
MLALGLLAAALLVTALAPAAGAAQKPCWERLIDDWYDGQIDKTYPVKCYREAQEHLPQDARLYSSLAEDLERALASVSGRDGRPPGPNTPIPPIPGLGRNRSVAPTDGNGEVAAGDEGGGWLDSLAPSNADSIPIPLLVLAGLATLLLAAAATSFLARRIQARRAALTASPGERDAGA